jgi:hypothetical protein
MSKLDAKVISVSSFQYFRYKGNRVMNGNGTLVYRISAIQLRKGVYTKLGCSMENQNGGMNNHGHQGRLTQFLVHYRKVNTHNSKYATQWNHTSIQNIEPIINKRTTY